jgi:hypothetical protein
MTKTGFFFILIKYPRKRTSSQQLEVSERKAAFHYAEQRTHVL